MPEDVNDVVKRLVIADKIPAPTKIPHSAMHQRNAHLTEYVHLTHDTFLFTGRFFTVSKVLALSPAHVVDVGCGSADLREDLRHNMAFMPYIGMDIEQRFKLGKMDAFVLVDLAGDVWPLRQGLSECIVCSEVLEHLSMTDGEALLERMVLSLLPGDGRLIMTFPCNRPSVGVEADYQRYGHLHWWKWDDFIAAVEFFGGEIKEIWTARHLGERTSNTALKQIALAKYGMGVIPMMEDIETRYGVRMFKGLFGYLVKPEEARGINVVIGRHDAK